MRKLSAHFIFNGYEWIKNAIVSVDDDGTILDLSVTDFSKETEHTEFYNGILCPGFINTHCHLELSHLKNTFEPKTRLTGFVKQMQQVNRDYSEKVQESITIADKQMQEAGIIACADITNTSNSIAVKETSSIHYLSLIELFSPQEELSDVVFSKGLELEKQYSSFNSSVTPHAPYSVSLPLMQKIRNHAENSNHLLSLHLFESADEKELFYKFQQHKPWEKINNRLFSQNPSLLFALELPKGNPVLFVHNTFIKPEDFEILSHNFPNRRWVLCPKSNLFIEDSLPPVRMLMKEKQRICIGTDSYASNTSLSVLEELKVLSAHFPELTLKQLLSFATLNGANALNISEKFGTIEKGKKPGILLLTEMDLQQLRLTQNAIIQRLI
jgi:cytosine/adenosine deaminase-related metal-dependent hydrolase